jgi:cobalt-zinc-cadmium efflux system protein
MTIHNHDHEQNGLSGAFTSGKKLVLVIILNLIITAAEYIGGVISGSLALISDAGHNFSDVMSLLLGLLGQKVSEIKPDNKFSFGMKRFEVLIALVNALALFAIGIFIIYEAVIRYLNPVNIDPYIMLPVAVTGLVGNALSIFILHRSREQNLNMRAAFLHLFYDAVSSVVVIAVGITMIFTNIAILDLIASAVIVLMIAMSMAFIYGQ